MGTSVEQAVADRSQDIIQYFAGELQKAYPISWVAVKAGLPPAGLAGRVKLTELVSPQSRAELLDPSLLRLHAEEVVEPLPSAKALVGGEQEWGGSRPCLVVLRCR